MSQQIDFNGTVGRCSRPFCSASPRWNRRPAGSARAAGIDVAKKRGNYKGRKEGTSKADPRRAKRLREKGLTMDEIAAAFERVPNDYASLP